MKKEEIIERMRVLDDAISKINKAIEQSVQNLNALNGGKMECAFWLQQLEAKDASVVAKSEDAAPEATVQ